MLLVSAPYALKAGDAETLGGKPASAFLAASGNATSGNNAIVDPVTGGGKKDYIPLWLSKTKLGKSNLFQSAAGDLGIGTTTPASTLDVQGTGSVRDTLTLFPKGTDPTLSVQGTGFGVSNTGVVSFVSGQTFPGTGTITGVTAGTDLKGGGTSGNVTLNLDTTKVPQLKTANTFTGNQTVNGNLSATGVVSGSSYQIGSNLFAFGSYANANAFLGFAGNSTTTGTQNVASGVTALSSNTSGTYNTAIGYGALASNTTGGSNMASGRGALFSNTTGGLNVASGEGALYSNTTAFDNTASGADALYSNTTASDNTASGYTALFNNTTGKQNVATGSQALYFNTTGGDNTATGYQALLNNTAGENTAYGSQALSTNTDGFQNTATGYQVLYSNQNGVQDTADGTFALYYNTTGYEDTAVGANALLLNQTGFENTGVGSFALNDNITGNNLTCIGYMCDAGVDGLHNATAIGAHAIVGASDALVLGGTGQYAVKVGIGTTTPSSILTIARGAGHPVSDSWETYSSRRWKTNIQTLPDALAKVEQLRGVSYDQKDSGKHEVGVIAEEVGKVVPEVVTYEDNGKDARGVDYSRLTALLIEAVKQQQREIRDLKSELRATRQTLETVKAQVSASRPTMVAAR